MDKNFKPDEEKNSNSEAEKDDSATDSVKIFADEDLGSLYADNETFFKLIKRLLALFAADLTLSYFLCFNGLNKDYKD